jgi:hypothetical protein
MMQSWMQFTPGRERSESGAFAIVWLLQLQ